MFFAAAVDHDLGHAAEGRTAQLRNPDEVTGGVELQDESVVKVPDRSELGDSTAGVEIRISIGSAALAGDASPASATAAANARATAATA